MPIIDPTDQPIPTAPYIITVNQPYATGYQIGPNQMLCFPFLCGYHQRVMYNVLHTSLEVQDYTLAAWFSIKPHDPILFYQNRESTVHLLKRKACQFAVQDINYNGSQKIPPLGVRTLFLPTDEYFFNIENITGHINKFEFQFTITDLPP